MAQTPFDGREFERRCAEQLRDQGWTVLETPTSGDQGVDLIARGNGISVAIQCKDWAGKVGNSAVQEVFAGKTHYKLDKAAIITRSSYTSSAYALATTTGVILLHFDDLRSVN